MCVSKELDVANFEVHVKSKTIAHLLDDSNGSVLLGRERRDKASVAETRETPHKVWVELAVDATFPTRLEIEERGPDPVLLTDGDLALSVKIPDRLGCKFGNVGVLSLKGVPHLVTGNNVTLSSLQGASDTKQAYDVRVVGVKELASIGAVDADTVDLGAIIADILDVTKHMTTSVLRVEEAQVCA